MKLIYTALCLLSCFQFYGQKVNLDPCLLYKQAIKNQNVDSIDHYLRLDDTQLYKEDRIRLLVGKGVAIVSLNKKRNKKDKIPTAEIVDSSYQLFTQAIDLEEDENLKIEYIWMKHNALAQLKPAYPGLAKDKEELKRHNFKDFNKGSSIQLASKYDGDLWLGVEASVGGALQLPYQLKDGYGATIANSKLSVSLSGLTFSYLRNIEVKASEFKFALMTIEAPVYIDITQIGFISTEGKSHWFYRPQLGFGYRRFSLSYGYNIFFKSSPATLDNKHSINFKTKFVF